MQYEIAIEDSNRNYVMIKVSKNNTTRKGAPSLQSSWTKFERRNMKESKKKNKKKKEDNVI